MLHIHMDAAQKWGPDYRPRAEKIVSSSFSHSIDCVVICVCVCVCVSWSHYVQFRQARGWMCVQSFQSCLWGAVRAYACLFDS